MKCKLCEEKEANKKNTHYLTDSIIKSCLNMDGGSTRESGYFFDFSNNLAFIEPGFQRETSIGKLEAKLGRSPTDEEIEKAKQNPFSVDNVFCFECEDIFTRIEKDFLDNILPKLREQDIDRLEEIEFEEIKTMRFFFYIQIWRTYICEKDFELKEETANKLHDIILKYDQTDTHHINYFPLAITYLNTIGGEKEYTRNSVGFTNDRNPNLILMNDIVVQFYEDENSIDFFDFYGLNDKNKFKDYININENKFIICIFKNKDRIELVKKIRFEEKIKKLRPAFKKAFIKLWKNVFGGLPSEKNVEDYIELIFSKAEVEALQFSRDRVVEITQSFILQRSAVENNKEAFQRLGNL